MTMTKVDFANFLGWCFLLNFGLLLATTIVLCLCGGFLTRLHASWFDAPPKEIRLAHFRYLATYKLLIIVLNLVPYLAMRILLR